MLKFPDNFFWGTARFVKTTEHLDKNIVSVYNSSIF